MGLLTQLKWLGFLSLCTFGSSIPFTEKISCTKSTLQILNKVWKWTASMKYFCFEMESIPYWKFWMLNTKDKIPVSKSYLEQLLNVFSFSYFDIFLFFIFKIIYIYILYIRITGFFSGLSDLNSLIDLDW